VEKRAPGEGCRARAMTNKTRATAMRRAALSAALVLSSLPAVGQHGHPGAPPPRSSPAPRSAQPARQQAPRNQSQSRPPASRPRPNNVPSRTQLANPYGAPQNGGRLAYPGATYAPQGTVRPALPAYPGATPPGHLQSWLNEHRNVPVANQEQQLRSDPSFKRLAPGEQQRLVQQLHSVNQMPDEVRQRRIARAEMMERLSPQERMRVNRSAREWTTLPADRQTVMKNAFRDLRSVPPDQRSIVLNSARYQGQFSPQERGILSDMLKVEPYEAPR
jgi:hypothetical protein